ncbi:MAG: hypothetical protein RLZZ126_767 [Pseudomonadota bacterium]|jgi:DNA polymerase-3 subunit delta'
MSGVAPWIARNRASLLAQRGHALLLAGPSGLGHYDLALELARAWLCEQPGPDGACGQCGSCHAIDVRTHADLCVLMPETAMLERGWPLPEKAQSDIDDKKRKPSQEIRVDAVRDVVEFGQRTDARGQGKVVLVFPAEKMNGIAANALLKTLEEPPGSTRFVLATEAADQLLPTIRSRCQLCVLAWPTLTESRDWLQQIGADPVAAELLLRVCGQRPQDAQAFLPDPKAAVEWREFPRAMQRGDVTLVAQWPARQLLDGIIKLCHDLQAVNVGAAPRFFSAQELPQCKAGMGVLSRWGKALLAAGRHIDHPYQQALLHDSLVADAQVAINSPV